MMKRSSHGKFDTKDKLNVYECWWHTHIFTPSKQEMDKQVETAPFFEHTIVSYYRSLDPFSVQFLVHSGLCNHKSFQDIRLVVFVMYIELVATNCAHFCQANGNPLPKVSNRKRVLAARLGIC